MQADVDTLVANHASVSRPLAAFLVRYVGYRDGGSAPWHTARPLPASELAALARRATSSTAPSDATLRLQAAYTSAYYRAHSALEGSQRAQARRLEELLTAMDALASGEAPGGGGAAAAAATGGSTALLGAATPASVGALSDLHRHLLDFCATLAGADAALGGRRPAPGSLSPSPSGGPLTLTEFATASARESLAALESVYPRSSIPALAALDSGSRAAQAVRASRLALGVRLFNWALGKGGLGLEHTPARGLAEAQALERALMAAMRAAMAACDAYMDVYAAAGGRGGGREARLLEALAASGADEGAWPEELVNRRQVALLCVSLAGEVAAPLAALQGAAAGAERAVGALRAALAPGSASSGSAGSAGSAGGGGVRREAVFPHFEALAEAWLSAADARAACACTAAVWEAVAPFCPPAPCTLPDSVKQLAQAGLGLAGRAGSASALPIDPPPPAADAAAAAPPVQAVPLADIDPATATVECGGFCPVSLAQAPPALLPGGASEDASRFSGTLVHGDASLGYLRHAGRLYCCASREAAEAFCAAPAHYVARAAALALAHPHLVFPLQLYVPGRAGHLPELNLPLLARFEGELAEVARAVEAEGGWGGAGGAGGAEGAAGAGEGAAGAGAGAPPQQRRNRAGVAVADAGVATPVHFVERYIDPRYSFSEWTLRRSALQMARLRQCATVSVQSSASAFRRDNDSQVYLPVSVGAQTVSSVGVATDVLRPQVVQVRGARDAVVEAATARKLAGLPAMPVPSAGGGGSGRR